MTPISTRTNSRIKKNLPTTAVVVTHPSAGKLSLLEAALDQSGFWSHLGQACRKAKMKPDQFPVLIKPDMGFFARGSATGTDPALVEHLIDLLHNHGYTQVVVGESRNSFDLLLENRDVLVLADLAGYQFATEQGRAYDVVDLGEDLIEIPFKPGSVLEGSKLARTWVEAGFRICFAKNKTDEENYYALCLHTLLGVLPLRDKDYHYRYRLQPDDVLTELLAQSPPDFCLVDAFISCHGSAGSRLERPLKTNTVIASANLLLADWAGAVKMGLDPFVSPLNASLLRRTGLPLDHKIEGDLAPYPGWINVQSLMAGSTQSRARWMELNRMVKPWLQRVDTELFPFKDLVNHQINTFAMRYLDNIDENAFGWWGMTGANYWFGATYNALEAYRIMYDKKNLRWKEAPLNVDPASFSPEDFDAIAGYLDPLADLLTHTESDSSGMRWRYLDGSVLFEFSREIPAPYDDFTAHVEIHKSIMFMNDYIGGTAVPVERDELLRVTRQVERNLYLPQPNYLALYAGKMIDVTKIEKIEYGDDYQRIYWKTVKSENSSAEYDDGTITFSRTPAGETRISVFGRQQFILPLFWQVFDLDYNPPLKGFLVSSAYNTFFSQTIANFEARYEGREVRIGRPWDINQGEPSYESDEFQPTEKLTELLDKLGEFSGPIKEQSNKVWAWPEQTPSQTGGTLDEEGFLHFQGKAPGSDSTSSSENGSRSGIPGLPPQLGEALRDFITGLTAAIQKDMGLYTQDKQTGDLPQFSPQQPDLTIRGVQMDGEGAI